MIELLNGRHFEGGATGKGAMYGVAALRQHCYIFPQPTIYLVLEFETNWLKKKTEFLNERHLEGDAAGNGAVAPGTAP